MQLDTAKTIAPLVAQIECLTSLLALIDTAIAESWPITVLRVTAPDTGSAQPAGTTIDVVPPGRTATKTNSDTALKTARSTYQAQLDALNAQLAAL